MITVHNVVIVPTRRLPLPPWVIDQRRELGDNILRYRRRAGLSQDHLAERIGRERRSIQRYERGERDISFSDLVLIADALGVSVADLVGPPPAGS
ncbi:helix-turn-helix domain-containing protein [Streptomyces sp. NPDC058664]|uniref:helix-turn-helix domain-containing protein n=1 Tax=unclassified Streptomyces TaxID=2593676 RepID=UPI0036467C03